jgi:hypothetical protein
LAGGHVNKARTPSTSHHRHRHRHYHHHHHHTRDDELSQRSHASNDERKKKKDDELSQRSHVSNDERKKIKTTSYRCYRVFGLYQMVLQTMRRCRGLCGGVVKVVWWVLRAALLVSRPDGAGEIFLRQTSKMPSFRHLYTQMPSFPLFHQNAISSRMDKLVGSSEQHQWVTVGGHEIKLNKKFILKQVT